MEPSNQPPSALPREWVEKLFTLMACTYGSKFADLWIGQDMEIVKAHWAKKLGVFPRTAVAKAVQSLDKPFPPTLPEFMELCRQASRREESAILLPSTEVPKEVAAARAEEVKKLAALAVKSNGNRRWAHALREAYLRGRKLEPIQIILASAALSESWSRSEIAIEPLNEVMAA